MTLMSLRAALSAVVLAGCTAALTGCGINPETALTSSPETGAAVGAPFSGKAFGGQQPINGGHVYIFSTGATGYGSASTSLLVSTSGTSVTPAAYDGKNWYIPTNASGAFFLSAAPTCTVGTQAYAYTVGGDPGFGTNSAVGLLIPLGPCSTGVVQPPGVSFVQLNEITTAVTAYALAGFASSPTAIGATGLNNQSATGLANAMNTALNIVNIGTGYVYPTSPVGNAVLPVDKIDLIANDLAACINTAGPGSSGCTSLYSDTGAASGSDTAAVALALAHSPFPTSAHASNLYTLGAPPSPIFPVNLPGAPADFTLGLQYKTPQYNTGVTNYSLAVDSLGNLWTRGTNSAGTTSSFVKYSPLGAASSPITVTTATSNPNYSPDIHLAIDSANNVWSGTLGGEIEIPAAATTSTALPNHSCAISGSLSSTVFGSNGVTYAADRTGGHIWEFNSTGCIGSILPPTSTIPNASFLGYLASETSGGFVATGTDTSNDYVFRYAAGATAASQTYEAGGEYITTDGSKNVWTYSTIGGATFDQLFEFNSSNAGLAPASGYYEGGMVYRQQTLRAGTEAPHIDGAGAAWVAVSPCLSSGNCYADYVVGLPANVSTSTTGITPAVAANGSTPANYGLALPNGETGAHALALDGSGSLWISVTDGSLIQFVGLATPVATPVLYNNLGVKP